MQPRATFMFGVVAVFIASVGSEQCGRLSLRGTLPLRELRHVGSRRSGYRLECPRVTGGSLASVSEVRPAGEWNAGRCASAAPAGWSQGLSPAPGTTF